MAFYDGSFVLIFSIYCDISTPICSRDMSLYSVLHDYNKSNYQLTPVILHDEDYNTYYGGISNGLLWPALHNLPEYIVKDYDDIQVRRLIILSGEKKVVNYCLSTLSACMAWISFFFAHTCI